MKKLLSIVLTGAVALSTGAYYISPAQQTSLTANAAEKYQMLEYEVVDGKTIKITGCLDIAKGEVVVPSSIKDFPVTEIWGDYPFVSSSHLGFIPEGAFLEKKYITSVVLPDTLRTIGACAFEGSSIEMVNLPENLESLGRRAFLGSNLKSVTIPEKIRRIEVNTFSECSLLESVVIEDGIEFIGDGAFENCKSLKSITIPESVSEMGSGAFKGCNSMQTAVVKGEVLGQEAFNDCKSLKSITIENPYCDIYNAPETISDTAVIYGYENSTAQFYAEVYGREFRLIGEQSTTEALKGDANGDNSVTIADAVAILQYLANPDEYPLSEQGLKNADVLGDDGINTEDALQIQKLDAGVIDKL